jgi:hypothetical protein
MSNYLRVGIDEKTGLEVYREVDNFIGGIKEPKITVNYREWLVTPNGTKLEPPLFKKYYIVDIPAVTRKGAPVLVTPESLAEDGVTVISAVYRDGDIEIVTPANLQYTSWRRKQIIQQYVGATLGDDLIIGSINATLVSLPTDVIDGHIITNS